MAKTRPQSKHSRAARRATSPSIDIDKSLKRASLPRAAAAASSSSSAAGGAANPSPPQPLRPSVLAAHRSAAVQKTSRPVRKARMSARARRRHEKGLEMAEAVGDRTAAKVQRSAGRQRVVNARRKAWDDINKLAVAANPFDALAADGRDDGADAEAGPADMDVSEDDAAPALQSPAIDRDDEVL